MSNKLIEDLKEKIRLLEIKDKELQVIKDKEGAEAFAAFVPEYSFERIDSREGVHLKRRMTNWADFEALKQEYGRRHYTFKGWDEEYVTSIEYYVTDEGILDSRGGGNCILNTPMLCDPEEWAAIKMGNIPAKYTR